MKISWWCAGLLLLLSGCATVEMAEYTVTSFAEVALTKKDAKNKKPVVKIVSSQIEVDKIAGILEAELKKSDDLKIVGDEEPANYWFILNGLSQYGTSVPQAVVSVGKEENESGGREVLIKSKKNLASAVTGVSVAVYETETLAPVHYFEIPLYCGDNTTDAVRKESVYRKSFAKDVVERIKDAFLTQQKKVETPMPLEADSALRDYFAKTDYINFLMKYKELGVIDLGELCEQIRTKTYEGSDADKKLGNYYLYLLVKESRTKDPETLEKILGEHLMMLETTKAKGLAESIPVALARLEYKLANIKR